MDLLKSEPNISSIVNVLKELCCCSRCILRFLGVQHSEVGSAYKNPLDYLDKLIAVQQPESILDIVNESSSKKRKPNICPVCLDCFREETIEKLVKDVASLGLEHFNYNNFVFNVSFPKCLAIRAHSMLLHLRNHFPVFESVNLYDAKASPIDEVLLEQPHKIFRAVAVDILSKVLNKQYYPKAHLNLLISIKYEKDDEEVENMKNLIRNKRSKKQVDISRNNILEHLKDVQDKLFTQHFTIPPVIPDSEVQLDRVQVTTDPIFIGGRYLKFKRNVGQTPWIVDGVSVTEHNVQDIVFDAIFNVLRCEKKHMTFSASGREDVDVRMLGTGRPFYVKIDNAKQRQFSSEQLREVERQVIKSELVAVTKLQSIFSSDLTRIKSGEESKRKTYKALCKTAAPNIQTAIDILNKQSQVTVAQLTVMRVLHRRTLMARDKTIYSMSATEVPGHSDLFELEIVTQAGTYVKEFVHGDFERTHPSVSSILGHATDLVALDCMDIDLVWPEKDSALTLENVV